MYWLLVSETFISFYDYNKSGSTIQHLYQNVFNEFKFPLPPLEEQTQIANYLNQKTTELDTLIANKEQLIKLLEEERTAMINQAVTKGLDPNVPMKDSGIDWLGEIPEHWTFSKMKFICDFILDGTHGTHQRVDEGYRLLSVRNIINGEFKFRDDDSRVAVADYEAISSRFKIQSNDIQLAIVGATLGKVALINEITEDFVTQRSLATIRTLDSICNAYFLFFYIKSVSFQSYLWLNTGFSAQPGVYLGTLNNCSVPLPSLLEQNEIVNYIKNNEKRLDNLLDMASQEINLLKEYKTALIGEVVTGKVDVRQEVVN